MQYGFGPVLYLVSLAIAFVSALASVILDVAFAVFFALPAFSVADAGRAIDDDDATGVGDGATLASP